MDRSGIYPALTVLLFACLVGLVSSCDRPRLATLAWAIGSALSLGALWAVREEWLLLLPALVCGLVLAVVRLSRAPIAVGLRVGAALGVVCIPLTIVAGTLWLEHVDEEHYGVAITNVERRRCRPDSARCSTSIRRPPSTSFP